MVSWNDLLERLLPCERHLYIYASGIIDLTCSSAASCRERLEQGAQLKQIVRPKPGAARRGLRERVIVGKARPRRQHRAQPAPGVKVRQPVFTPCLTTGRRRKAGTSSQVEGVRDLE